MNIFDAAEKLKCEMGNDYGVYEILTANRFGTDTIVVGCVTNEDCKRIAKKIPKMLMYFTHTDFVSSL
jgi:hypothetical protein